MGQCSTLPTEGRSANSTKRGDSVALKREDSTHRHKEKCSPTQGQSKRNSSLQVQTQNGSPSPSGQFPQGHHDPTHLQARNPEQHGVNGPTPMEEDNPREDVPQPPAVAVRTRCYKLNLNAEMHTQPQVFLGPYAEPPPPLTYSDSEDSSSTVTPTQVIVQTAKIFRGITVAKDGTILSQNARATRSSRGSKNKRGEKSRQATKIDKAKDLVEESILTGKSPESDEPANMMSLVIMGEYDDMKYLVRDGSKKLRDAADLPDDSLLSINRFRGIAPGSQHLSTSLSPRKRVSPNYNGQQVGVHHSMTGAPRQGGFPQSAPPKLKSNPRDRPSSRRGSEEKTRNRDFVSIEEEMPESTRQPTTAAGDGDWSNALSFSRGFHSIWNCGGTGEETGTISPTQVVSPKDGKSHTMGIAPTPYKPVFEGRDSNYGQAREAGVTTRAN